MVWIGRGSLFQSLFPAMSVYVRVGKGKSMVSQADTEWSEQRLGTEWIFLFVSGYDRIKHSEGILRF